MAIVAKTLESKIAKTLRKANRLKSTSAKLDKINECLEELQTCAENQPQTGRNHSTEKTENHPDLQAYIELCLIHKLKFQLDALVDGIRADLEKLQQVPEQMTQPLFDHLLHRLHVTEHIDAHHPDLHPLLQQLLNDFPQNVEGAAISEPPYMDVRPYQTAGLVIDITCRHSDIMQVSALQRLYAKYQKTPSHNANLHSEGVCQLRFSKNQLDDFAVFHEELRIKPGYRIRINDRAIKEHLATEWFQCYQRHLKAGKIQYCYGASPFTFNFMGCHKLRMPDVAKTLEQCWFHYGTLDPASGFFLVDRHSIVRQMLPHLAHCGFCPALRQKKLLAGLALLPQYINPECNSRWQYFIIGDKRVGVIPRGREIAIALTSPLNKPATASNQLIEIGSTPHIEKMLRYLENRLPESLAETTYADISHCPHCGAAYKRHTMICTGCKTEFWKLALKAPETIIAGLRETKAPSLQPADPRPQAGRSMPTPLDQQNTSVSFDQLWSDPAIQQILSPPLPVREEPVAKPRAEASLWTAPEAEFETNDRFDLHGKLRSLISKKYREQQAIENAFSQPTEKHRKREMTDHAARRLPSLPDAHVQVTRSTVAVTSQEKPLVAILPHQTELVDAVKRLKPRKKSELSKRGVVRVIYHATMDKDICPLCAYLDGLVMDPDDPSTDIFSPPLFPGCTCRREYVLKTEKQSRWPQVTFTFPPEELLGYLQNTFE